MLRRAFLCSLFTAVAAAACGSGDDQVTPRSARPASGTAATSLAADTRPRIVALGDSLTAGLGLDLS
jgi:hypothetical protein